MKRKPYRPFLIFGIFLFSLFYLPSIFVQKMRQTSVGMSKGMWRSGAIIRSSFIPIPTVSNVQKKELSTENLLLKKQNEMLRRRLLSEERIDNQINRLEGLVTLNEDNVKGFYKRRIKACEKELNLELFFLPATVIYRDPSLWNATVWINVGEDDNLKLDYQVVSVGSVVLSGEYLIGVIEEVGRHKSRVRLLTDSSVALSVRVARGEGGNREILRIVEQALQMLVLRGEPQENFSSLVELKNKLEKGSQNLYLAKGELYGSSSPLWRGRSEVVKGVGFNYDFGDEEGPPLELRSGKPIDHLNQETRVALIEVGDLLVTTGMDGVFPKDLPVAYVTKVKPLKEGSVSFEIEAKLLGGPLDTLLNVVVLPPLISPEDRS